jgi:hypothetical protein
MYTNVKTNSTKILLYHKITASTVLVKQKPAFENLNDWQQNIKPTFGGSRDG